MLAFIFRGFFLIGVISWYSNSVWKMIDVYFKNRFESYLKAEYDKNPHMLADVEAYRTNAGNKELPTDELIHKEEKHLNDHSDVCTADVCRMNNKKEEEEEEGQNDLKINRAIPVIEAEAFIDPKKVLDSRNKITKPTEPCKAIDENKITKVDHKSLEAMNQQIKTDSTKRGIVENIKTPGIIDRGKIKEVKRSKKKKFKTIILTEKDFQSTKIKVTQQDFAEFDLDDERNQNTQDESDSVLISDLPFKPKLDISDLQRISPQEFCPVILEDEFSCDETKTWP